MRETEKAIVSGTTTFVPTDVTTHGDGLSDDEDPDGESTGQLLTYGRDILVVDDNDTNLIAIEAALLPL
jgi:hypothetical protein